MKPKIAALYAAYVCLVVGLSLWQYRNYRASFETVVPYTHSGNFTVPSEEVRFAASDIDRSEALPPPETVDTMETIAPDPTEAITYPLNLNTATPEELCSLPGIGEVTAAAICDYRTQIGGFRNMRQLLEIYGIGEAKYQAILPYLYLEELNDPPETAITPSAAETEPPSIPILNLNRVTKEELMLLPGCSAQIAENILYLRDVQIHTIYNPLEITMADGVTDELYIQWSPYLAVDDEGGTQLPIDVP